MNDFMFTEITGRAFEDVNAKNCIYIIEIYNSLKMNTNLHVCIYLNCICT